ncbi:unannotated protein [freshwater metagenome]|uniref:Unannotated protein n=1 Tax=freshwater metagenome TaxID=449393 RepID=A0A6J7FRA8_9ZZZZ
MPAAGRGEVGPHRAGQQPHRYRGRRGHPGPQDPGRAVQVPAADPDRRGVQPQTRPVLPGAAGTERTDGVVDGRDQPRVRPVHRRGRQRHPVGERGPGPGTPAAEPAGRPTCHRAGPGGVVVQQGPGEQQLGLGLRLPDPGPAVGGRRRHQQPLGLRRHAGRQQGGGPVGVAGGRVHRRDPGQHLPRAVHPADRRHKVTGQQVGVPEVVPGLGLVQRCAAGPEGVAGQGEVLPGADQVTPLQVHVAAVQGHLAQQGRLVVQVPDRPA